RLALLPVLFGHGARNSGSGFGGIVTPTFNEVKAHLGRHFPNPRVAHQARSPPAIMGKGDTFGWDGIAASADFSVAYADQNELDHAALAKAVRTGKGEG